MNAKSAASFLSVEEVWGVDELAGLLGNGFANELRLGSGSGNGLKEFGVKVREKALILVSAHLLRIPVANHALRDGTLATNPERTSS